MTQETTKTTMRQLLARWAEVEPDKIEHEQWNDEVSGNTCEEFRISGVAVFSDFLKVGESSPALIQWAVQQAIIARGWPLELEWDGEWEAWVNYEWASSSLNSLAEALLGAYLKSLEASK